REAFLRGAIGSATASLMSRAPHTGVRALLAGAPVCRWTPDRRARTIPPSEGREYANQLTAMDDSATALSSIAALRRIRIVVATRRTRSPSRRDDTSRPHDRSRR